MKDFLADNADKIWTIVATIIGAIISYVATTSAEKKKIKRNDQKEKLKDILIPYCSLIETAIEAVQQCWIVYQPDVDEKIKLPTEYLKAEKRVYLSKKQRDLLKSYDAMVKEFFSVWATEQKSVFRQYIQWISMQVMDYPNPPISPMHVYVSLNIKDDSFKIPILEKNAESYKNFITSIDFVRDDDPENIRSYTVRITDDIKRLCEMIDFGELEYANIEDPENQVACAVCDYILELDDKSEMKNILSKTKTSGNLSKIDEKAKEILNSLLKEIDRITN